MRKENILPIIGWALFYSVVYSLSSGITNGVANLYFEQSFLQGLQEAFINAIGIGILINLIYPLAVNKLKEKGKLNRLTASLLPIIVNGLFFIVHYALGTSHPFITVIPNTIAGILAANFHRKNVSFTLF